MYTFFGAGFLSSRIEILNMVMFFLKLRT